MTAGAVPSLFVKFNLALTSVPLATTPFVLAPIFVVVCALVLVAVVVPTLAPAALEHAFACT